MLVLAPSARHKITVHNSVLYIIIKPARDVVWPSGPRVLTTGRSSDGFVGLCSNISYLIGSLSNSCCTTVVIRLVPDGKGKVHFKGKLSSVKNIEIFIYRIICYLGKKNCLFIYLN